MLPVYTYANKNSQHSMCLKYVPMEPLMTGSIVQQQCTMDYELYGLSDLM